MDIEPFSFDQHATADQRQAIRPALEEMAALIGDRLKAITLVPKKAAQMPDWNQSAPGVQPAWGVWKGWNRKSNRREIWYWEEVNESKDCIPLIQHEGFHAYDDIYLSQHPEIRDAVMEMMTPEPVFWQQGQTWGKFPFECAAVYGSAAMFDIAKPVYAKLLDRKIAPADWPELKELLLS